METLGKIIVYTGVLIVALLAIVAIAFVFAYPTMWAVNYLFAPSFLTFVFGTAKIGLVKSVILNFVSGWLIRGINTSTKK